MAILNITEVRELSRDQTGQYIPVANHGSATIQEITGITSSAKESSAFKTETCFLRLNADINVRYVVGTAPSATATSTRLPADVTEIIGIPRGKNFLISVRTA